tara:strand:+ start:569 stop:808 length:240 start_codon:yes stop_codon:yes gene_type:complete
MNTNDPNFFPMSKIPDLIWQLKKQVVTYDQVRQLRADRKFDSTKYQNRYYVQVDSLEKYLGVDPGSIRTKFNGEWTGWT